MKFIKLAFAAVAAQFIVISQAFAQCAPGEFSCIPGGGGAVPEIDGSGAIIAIGLVAGLVALIREKFYR